MPFFFEKPYYASIVAVLRAADNIAAQVRENGKTYSIEVKLTDGSQVLWTNTDQSGRWAYTVVRSTEAAQIDLEEGGQSLEDLAAASITPLAASEQDNAFVRTMHSQSLSPEQAAVMIAEESYPEPAETVTSDH